GLQLLAHAAEKRLLQREDEGRGLDRRKAGLRARARKLAELVLDLGPRRPIEIVEAAVLRRHLYAGEKRARLLAQLRFLQQIAAQGGGPELCFEPVGKQLLLMMLDHAGDAACRL